MKFSDFCKLIYECSTSITYQKAFVKKYFEGTGASFQYSPDYYQKLSDGEKKSSPDISEQIPNTIQNENVVQLLMQIFDVPNASAAIDKVGIPKLEVNLQAWVASMEDQLQIIIHLKEVERKAIIASNQANLNNPEERDVRYIRLSYPKHGLWVENPPLKQNSKVPFYKRITYRGGGKWMTTQLKNGLA